MKLLLNLVISSLVAGSSFAAAAPAPSAKPNIVYFLIDDMGYGDVGFNGCKDIRTPNLDQLANRGAVLTSFYAQPVCSPTRAALMTGRYPIRTGVYTVINGRKDSSLPLKERLLSEALRDAGYETAICGKWHLGEDKPEAMPTRRGFDHQYGFMSGSIGPFSKIAAGPGGKRDWYRDDKPSADEGYCADQLAAEACRIIAEKHADKPLFLYVPFHAVHTPWQSPEADEKPYANLKGRRQNLAGITAAADRAVGQIMAALDAKGLTENTLIIGASDNGGPSWDGISTNTPLRGGKGEIYEGGMRVCAFATWPGKIPAGGKIDEPMHMIDWYPTLVKLGGGSLQQPLPIDGKDIWPVLTQGAKSPHEEVLLIGSAEGQRAIRMGDWKLLINPHDRQSKRDKSKGATGIPVELYDLSKDIGETTNLAGKDPERVKVMQARLDSFLTKPAKADHLLPASEAPTSKKKSKRAKKKAERDRSEITN